jgi:hypothetical protein
MRYFSGLIGFFASIMFPGVSSSSLLKPGRGKEPNLQLVLICVIGLIVIG